MPGLSSDSGGRLDGLHGGSGLNCSGDLSGSSRGGLSGSRSSLSSDGRSLDGSGREILVGPGNYGRVQFLGDKIIFYDNAFLNFGYWIMDLDGSNLRYFGK